MLPDLRPVGERVQSVNLRDFSKPVPFRLRREEEHPLLGINPPLKDLLHPPYFLRERPDAFPCPLPRLNGIAGIPVHRQDPAVKCPIILDRRAAGHKRSLPPRRIDQGGEDQILLDLRLQARRALPPYVGRSSAPSVVLVQDQSRFLQPASRTEQKPPVALGIGVRTGSSRFVGNGERH